MTAFVVQAHIYIQLNVAFNNITDLLMDMIHWIYYYPTDHNDMADSSLWR